MDVLGKVAGDLEQALARRAIRNEPGRTSATPLAAGAGWSVSDVVCTAGPTDRRFEEQHTQVSIAAVIAGSFQYRSSGGRALLTAGAFLLGNAGEAFECGHDHASGDRCIAFHYAPWMFDEIVANAGLRRGRHRFTVPRLPPLRELSSLAVQAAAGATMKSNVSWEETAVQIAAAAIHASAPTPPRCEKLAPLATARVTESIRRIEREPAASWTLAQLAADARQSRYHFLRVFRQLTGVTPHQFVMRTRLRASALRLLADDSKVIDVALEGGFDDVSNFNAAFRREFGMAPLAYRASGVAR